MTIFWHIFIYELNIKKFWLDRENMKFKEDLDKKNDVNKSGFMPKNHKQYLKIGKTI